jgi:copper(I)-binding protein
MRTRGSVMLVRRLSSLLVALATLGVACTSSQPHRVASQGAPGPIEVQGTWASASGVRTALVYFAVSNPTGRDDVLLGASSDIGGRAIIRKEASAGRTHLVRHVEVPSGGEVSFQPGSYEVELVGVDRRLGSGSIVRLTLRFEHAGAVPVSAGVR